MYLSTIQENLNLGLSTTLIGMSIVFLVLIALWGIVALEHKFFEATGLGQKKAASAIRATAPVSAPAAVDKKGRFEGSLEANGTDDEQTAVILAAVSENADIPMNELRVKSIREVK